MSEITDRVEHAKNVRVLAYETLHVYQKELRDRRAEEFATAKGCPRCRGRGWVVTWDTLDSLSGCYAEYGTCPDAEVNAEAHGPHAPVDHSKATKYDHLRGFKVEVVQTDVERETLKTLQQAVDDAVNQEEYAQTAAAPLRGRIVKVVKGRKVAKGTEGEVFWVGEDRFHHGAQRVGFKTDAGDKHFTAAGNVEVI